MVLFNARIGASKSFSPAATNLLSPTPAFLAPTLKGLKLDPNNPLEMEFIIEAGNQSDFKRAQAKKLVDYFLAALTLPKDRLWVNLSPNEADRIIAETLSRTDIGRDLLEQDYVLKKFAASLTHPENPVGAQYWQAFKARAYAQYGITELPLETFHKVWIVPGRATIYESGQMAYIDESRLKVMLEDDYRAFARNDKAGKIKQSGTLNAQVSELAKEVAREILIPEIEREVNEGEHFALLRQIYHSLILALWYKQALTKNIVHQAYVDQSKTAGIATQEGNAKEMYRQYLAVFNEGVYNFINEEYDPQTSQIVARQYYSGGVNFDQEDSFSVRRVASSTLLRRMGRLTSAILFSIALTAIASPTQASAETVDDTPSAAVVDDQQQENRKVFSVNRGRVLAGQTDVIALSDRDEFLDLRNFVELSDITGLSGQINPVTGQANAVDSDYFTRRWDQIQNSFLTSSRYGVVFETFTVAAQTKLNELGYDIAIDGDYGPQTRQAIRLAREKAEVSSFLSSLEEQIEPIDVSDRLMSSIVTPSLDAGSPPSVSSGAEGQFMRRGIQLSPVVPLVTSTQTQREGEEGVGTEATEVNFNLYNDATFLRDNPGATVANFLTMAVDARRQLTENLAATASAGLELNTVDGEGTTTANLGIGLEFEHFGLLKGVGVEQRVDLVGQFGEPTAFRVDFGAGIFDGSAWVSRATVDDNPVTAGMFSPTLTIGKLSVNPSIYYNSDGTFDWRIAGALGSISFNQPFTEGVVAQTMMFTDDTNNRIRYDLPVGIDWLGDGATAFVYGHAPTWGDFFDGRIGFGAGFDLSFSSLVGSPSNVGGAGGPPPEEASLLLKNNTETTAAASATQTAFNFYQDLTFLDTDEQEVADFLTMDVSAERPLSENVTVNASAGLEINAVNLDGTTNANLKVGGAFDNLGFLKGAGLERRVDLVGEFGEPTALRLDLGAENIFEASLWGSRTTIDGNPLTAGMISGSLTWKGFSLNPRVYLNSDGTFNHALGGSFGALSFNQPFTESVIAQSMVFTDDTNNRIRFDFPVLNSILGEGTSTFLYGHAPTWGDFLKGKIGFGGGFSWSFDGLFNRDQAMTSQKETPVGGIDLEMTFDALEPAATVPIQSVLPDMPVINLQTFQGFRFEIRQFTPLLSLSKYVTDSVDLLTHL